MSTNCEHLMGDNVHRDIRNFFGFRDHPVWCDRPTGGRTPYNSGVPDAREAASYQREDAVSTGQWMRRTTVGSMAAIHIVICVFQ